MIWFEKVVHKFQQADEYLEILSRQSLNIIKFDL
jgi:hypothetical protein